MKEKLMRNSVCFYRRVVFAALLSICHVAYGDMNIPYSAVVTNVQDATHVVIDWRRDPFSERAFVGGPVLLDGIAVPEEGSTEEEALLGILRKTLLNKQVNVIEYLDGGIRSSRGVSVYVTDDKRRRAPEDNVNLMLVREGFARYSGIRHVSDGNLGGMKEAQRLAQEERKGIWAHYGQETNAVQAATPEPPPPDGTEKATPARDTDPPPPEYPSEPSPGKTLRWLAALLAIAALAGAAAWRHTKRKR